MTTPFPQAAPGLEAAAARALVDISGKTIEQDERQRLAGALRQLAESAAQGALVGIVAAFVQTTPDGKAQLGHIIDDSRPHRLALLGKLSVINSVLATGEVMGS